MKKTIAAVALLASSGALALVGPRDPNLPPPKFSKICLRTYVESDGSVLGTCDESNNNQRGGKTLLKNGCAEGQVGLTVLGNSPVTSCMPPGVVQL